MVYIPQRKKPDRTPGFQLIKTVCPSCGAVVLTSSYEGRVLPCPSS